MMILKRFLSLILSLQLVLVPYFASAQSAEGRVSPGEIANAAFQMKAGQLALENPLWEQFFEGLEKSNFEIKIPASDPLRDEDPYFLRSQTWQSGTKSNVPYADDVLRGYYFSKTPQDLKLRVPGVQKVLSITQGLTPLQVTDDYIFFSADTSGNLFEKKVADLKGQPAGEGLFFLHRDELNQAAIDNQPVSFYYFPLPGNGWKGNIPTVALNQFNRLAIENQMGEQLPIDLADVETVMKYEQLARMTAIHETLKSKNLSAFNNIKTVYPAPYSTAGFGMIGIVDKNASLFSDNFKKYFKYVHNLLLPQANAGVFDWLNIPVDAQQQLLAYAGIIGFIFISSIGLKYTKYKERMKEIAASDKAAREEVRKGLAQDTSSTVKPPKEPTRFGQWWKDIGTIFAHGTTVFNQIPNVTAGTIIQLGADGMIPALAAGEHTLIKKILNNTFLWAKNSAGQIAVNWKTFVLGVLTLGIAVDTTGVAIQDLWFFPMFCAWLAAYLPTSAGAQMRDIFVTNFEQTKHTIFAGIIRSGTGWTMGGSSAYSMDTQQQYMPLVESIVDSKLRQLNKDPSSPETRSYRQKMIKEILDQLLQQKGLPPQKDFLYDLNSIVDKVFAAFGFSSKTNDDYILEDRPLLGKAALRRAVAQAKKIVQQSPSTENQQVLSLLQSALRDAVLFDSDLIKNPKEALAAFRRTNTIITLLSYEDSLEPALKLSVVDWSRQYSPSVANAAGVLFRKGLYSLLDAREQNILEINKDTFNKYFDEANRIVLKQMREETPEVSEKEIVEKRRFDYEQLLDATIRELEKMVLHQQDVANYTPAKGDWLTKIQKEKALKLVFDSIAADESVQREFQNAKTQQDLQALSDKYSLKWKGDYTSALSKVLGLYVTDQTNQDLLSRVNKKAEAATRDQIELTTGLKEYLSQLSEFDRLKYEADLYSINYLSAYRDETVHDVERNATDYPNWQQRMLSPDQPGKFQKIRQSTVVRNSKLLTRFWRWADSWFDDEQFTVGVGPWAKRNLPLYSYFENNTIRSAKGFLPNTLIKYPMLVALFHLSWSFPTYVWFYIIGTYFISLPTMWLNSAVQKQGLKVMDGIGSKIKYGIPYTISTMWGQVPFLMLMGAFSKVFANIYPPLHAIGNALTPEQWVGAAVGTAVVGSPRFRNWVSEKLKGLYSSVVEQPFQKKVNSINRLMNLNTCDQIFVFQ